MSFLNSNLSLLIFLSFSYSLHITGCFAKCVSSPNATASDECYRGKCENEKCICDQGWTGDSCDKCEGRVLLTENEGIITDGPRNYTEGMECSWLIQPALTNPDVTIRLNVMEYASECGWDYLYIYDGDSAFSPLLATFTGYIIDGNKSNQDYRPEVVSSSNSLFLYFSSDVAYSMMGFYIKYSTHSCPQNCSENGVCDGTSKICSCDSMWIGNACERDACPGNCSQDLDQGNCSSTAQCDCKNGYQADDCSETIPAKQGFWTDISPADTTLNTNKASHGSVIYNETIYVFGGIQFGNLSNQDSLFKYNILTDQWSVFEALTDSPSPRYGHSMVLDGETIIVFGGRDTTSKETFSEIWQFDIKTNNWTVVDYTIEFSDNSNTAILSLWGHSATLVEFLNGSKIMVVMFGHNPLLEYSGFVFEYDISQRNWIIPEIEGANVNPTYGHTATWDPINKVIYVHGGYASMIFKVTDTMYRYDPYQRMFTVLRPSGVPRFLHASVLAGGVLYVEGGCTHNDSDRSTGARCFSPRLMAYYLSCDLWEHLPEAEVYTHPARYGHSANLHELLSGTKSMLIYGGYDSTMLGNMLSYQFGSCLAYSNETCIGTHHPGISCYWNETNRSCLAVESAQQFNQSSCRNLNDSSPAHCSKDNCETVEYCTRFKSCSQCQIAKCQWKNDQCTERTDNTTATCRVPCGSLTTCGSCTGNNVCMWCVNKGLCVSTNSYVVQFPYGECMKWITEGKDCSAKVGCSHLGLCRECQTNPFCGWCDDGSNTGLGSCQSGTSIGSVYGNSSSNVISTPTQDVYGSPPACQSGNWYFTDCPICQCNGHSECVGNTSICEKCQDRTTGDTCQTCVDGYFGDATNGGSCGPCVCNNQATSCNSTTGDCHCSTKGIIGSQCQRCEVSSKYRGDPTNGTCYYQLSINYSYNFSLNVLQDRYVTAINFENTPPNDNDVEVTFTSNKPCNVRVAVYLRFMKPSNNLSRRKRNIASNRTEDQFNEQELQVEEFIMTRSFKIDLSGSKYDFGHIDSESTVRLYVDNLTLPIWIQISMVQRNTNLLMLLLILFSCFLALLLLIALGWKVKMFYDSCQIRRQRTEMLEQMAARPFATLHLCLDDLNEPKQEQTNGEAVYAVTEEYCVDGLSSPVSVLLVMPSGCEDSGSQLTVDQPIYSTKEFPVQCSLGFGTALLMTSGRQDVTHRLQKRNSTTNNASHQKKLRVVFRKGGRRSHSGRSRRDQCGTQIDSNNSNNSDGNGQIRDRETSSVSRTALNNADQPTAARHGRHSFIPTIRSRSVSPTGGMDNSQQQRSISTRSPTTPVIVFSVNNPDMTHNSL